MNKEISPFIKWVGGKRQLIDKIKERMPKKFNNFFEPFLGGGALTLALKIPNTTINDISKELMDAYLCIKENREKLIKLLDEHEKEHEKNPKNYYYGIRKQDRELEWEKENKFVKSARFIYLNKTCFNGMYRVNKSGYFNVPWNKKTKISLYNRTNLKKLSTFLNDSNIFILNKDFEVVVKNAKKGDFVFFDPPYDVLNKTSFDSYNKEKFGVIGQKRLAKIAHELNDKGCYVMITNHNTELINELYKDFKIDVIEVKRLINSNASKRKGIETIIYNY